MKTLPEQIEDIDRFYKERSDDGYVPEVPEDVWQNIESELPSGPFAPKESAPSSIPQTSRNFTFLKGLGWYLAGVVSTIAVYTVYTHYQHKDNVEQSRQTDILIPNDSVKISTTEESGANEKSFSDQDQGSGNSGKSSLPHREKQAEITFPTQAEKPHAPEIEPMVPSENVKEQVQEEEAPLPIKEKEPEETEDFFHKHSKKAQDTLTKKLFIPKK